MLCMLYVVCHTHTHIQSRTHTRTITYTHTYNHTHTHIQSHTQTHTITHTHTHTLCVECHINRRRVTHTIDLYCRHVIRTTDWGTIGRDIRRLTWHATYDTPTIDVTYTCYTSTIDMTHVTRLRCALALCFTRLTVCVWHAYNWHDIRRQACEAFTWVMSIVDVHWLRALSDGVSLPRIQASRCRHTYVCVCIYICMYMHVSKCICTPVCKHI